MNFAGDVDIEVADRDNVAKMFSSVTIASQIAHGQLVRHASGLYFQNIPRHPLNDLAAFPYEEAESFNFSKIDLLSCPNPYDGITSMAELRALLAKPIDWEWFIDAKFVSTLFHLNGEVHLLGGSNGKLMMGEVVAYYKPKSIMDLAIMVAIKMPAKKYLISESWDVIREQIWIKEIDRGQQFKKSHSCSYGMVTGIDARKKAPEFFGLSLAMVDDHTYI